MAICMGATDPTAVASFQSGHANSRVVHLPRLHAKVYAADGATAIVTSGNLTGGGLRFNHEYGVLIRDPTGAARIHADIDSLSTLGAELDRAALQTFCGLAEEARDAYRAQMAAASSATVRRLRHALTSATDSLLHARLAGGPLHSVFAATIEHLLSRHGPMTTQQLHPLIQQMHPDLCDDSVDRVIDGKRFGKKWKHAVRTAQQQLKKRGSVQLADDRWMLHSDPENMVAASRVPQSSVRPAGRDHPSSIAARGSAGPKKQGA